MSAPDFGHTRHAQERRKAKALALAVAAAGLGLQPYELTVVGGTQVHADNRARVRRAVPLDRDPSVETWQATLGQLIQRSATIHGARQCLGCDFYVVEVITEAGKRLLVDPFPHPSGTVDTTGPRARVLAGHDVREGDEDLYRQHATSCPASPSARRSPGPRCTECAKPLDAVLAVRDPTYTIHPTCGRPP